MPRHAAIFACLSAMLFPFATQASEAQFLTSLQGRYEGKGQVRLRTDKAPINVSCSFVSTASATSVSLKGRCRGYVVVSRSISADLRASGANYSGTYIGAGSGPASLSGRRRGEALNLTVRWAKPINGDRSATLSVARVGSQGLRLTTTDKDPATGKAVITSDINLTRQGR